MDEQKNKKQVDGYITIGKSISESMNKISIPNQKLVDGINKGFIDAIKSINKYNLSIAKICTEEVLKKQSMISTMIEPLTELTKSIIEKNEPIINNAFSNITKIFEKMDWSQFDLIYKEIAIKYLSNGFYPYRNTEIKYEEILKTNSKIKQVRIIKDGIKKDIQNNKNLLLLIYPQYRQEVKEIYKLYKERNFRLCILSLINLISIINNSQFEYIDFTQYSEVRKKLIEKDIMKDKETNYLLFSPYIEDNTLKYSNMLIKNCNSIKYQHPEEYCEIPYNRNAILHGYSKKFGNEINCLRWFSVLFNTLEISQKLIESEKDINNQ